MTSSTNQIDDDLEREIHVFNAMIRELPAGVSQLLQEQFFKVLQAVLAKNSEWATIVRTGLDDIKLLIKLNQFDLEATARERDEYQKKLEE